MNILIGDDHPIIREGLTEFLKKNSKVKNIYAVENGREAYNKYLSVKPDFVILDISMQEMNGLDAARKIIEHDPLAKILFYSININRSEIYSCYKAGGMGFVSKEEPLENILKAMKSITLNKVYYGDIFTEEKFLDYELKCNQTNKTVRNLSFREKDILHYVAEGYSNSEISEVLHISIKTIEDHRRNIRKKMNIVGKAEFVKFAINYSEGKIVR